MRHRQQKPPLDKGNVALVLGSIACCTFATFYGLRDFLFPGGSNGAHLLYPALIALGVTGLTGVLVVHVEKKRRSS